MARDTGSFIEVQITCGVLKHLRTRLMGTCGTLREAEKSIVTDVKIKNLRCAYQLGEPVQLKVNRFTSVGKMPFLPRK